MLAPFTAPVFQELQGCARRAGMAIGPPLCQPVADQVDELQLDGGPGRHPLFARGVRSRRSVIVLSRAATRLLERIRAFLEVPMERRLLIG
ncbi:MAG: hypothetical protein A3F70_05695 [Acidobacteria bacterium RIFCSPLOWO2_12_FULL_67_14]|nr:MAG: hypothetical protein A3F70_05695 [Acidobacteria bacterium RIFCSPLOWO2_12_FULL_67_14]